MSDPERLFDLPPPEVITDDLIKEFQAEGGRLHRMGMLRFDCGSPWAPETREPGEVLDRVRYKKDGVVIEVIPFDEDIYLFGADPATHPINVVIQTPMPVCDEWPNVYLFENFIFEENGKFKHYLSVSEYTPKGMKIQDKNAKAVTSEHLPGVGQKVEDGVWDEISKLLVASLRGIKHRKFEKLQELFPQETRGFSERCTASHFLKQLALLRSINIGDEVGCIGQPFARQ